MKKNRKRREAYQRKKTASDVHFQDAEATPGVLTQLDNEPISKGELEHETLISIAKISLVVLMSVGT